MRVYEQYPMIARIMYMQREHEPLAYDPREDPAYKQAEEQIQSLEATLAGLVAEGHDLKAVLCKLCNAYSDMESTNGDYAFIEGFKTCARLFLEIMQ